MLDNLHLLTDREQQIANKIIEGLPNKAIANQLFISERTVKFHCANIYRKLSVRSRHALTAMYYNELNKRGYTSYGFGEAC